MKQAGKSWKRADTKHRRDTGHLLHWATTDGVISLRQPGCGKMHSAIWPVWCEAKCTLWYIYFALTAAVKRSTVISGIHYLLQNESHFSTETEDKQIVYSALQCNTCPIHKLQMFSIVIWWSIYVALFCLKLRSLSLSLSVPADWIWALKYNRSSIGGR